jgi:hypothetical protein
MKIVVIFPYREEYLAFEIIKSLLKFDAEIFCSKNIKNIKFILESNSQNHNIGTSVLDNCKICNDMEIIKKARSADYIFLMKLINLREQYLLMVANGMLADGHHNFSRPVYIIKN